MTNAWFLGAQHSVPQDENVARSTLDPIRTDPEEAQAQDNPEWNKPEEDASGQLTGLATREVASKTSPIEKYAPMDLPLATANHNAIIDNQVATSGTAAAREAAGIQGHGTMQIEIGIEPLNPAERFGNEYFVRPGIGANEGSGDYMTPTATDNWTQAVAQSAATENSRQASLATLFDSWNG